MPRFTLRQLLTSVLLACVYLAVLREAFGEVKYNAVAIIAWVMLAAFYFNARLRFILVAHCLTPLIAMALLLGLLVSDFDWAWEARGPFALFVFTGRTPFALFVFTCRTTSIVMFPLAILRLIERYVKKRSSPR